MPEVRLIGPGGEQVGIVRIEDALRVAADAEVAIKTLACVDRLLAVPLEE